MYHFFIFLEKEKFFIDDDNCIYRPVGNGCPAIFKNGKPKGCPVGSLMGDLNQFGKVSLTFGNCNRRGFVKIVLNDKMIKKSGGYGYSSNVVFDYHKGDSLKLEEESGGIIKIMSLTIEKGRL